MMNPMTIVIIERWVLGLIAGVLFATGHLSPQISEVLAGIAVAMGLQGAGAHIGQGLGQGGGK